MTSPWTVSCSISPEDDLASSELAGVASLVLFDFGAVAVSETATGSNVQLLAGFDSEDDARRASKHIETQLATATAVVRQDPDGQKWVEQQREGLAPTTINTWHIRAPWHDPIKNQDGDREIVIDPGAAFGHGAHPSTRLALELLDSALEDTRHESMPHVVDLGTGTGVIAIFAAKAGRTVRAIEYEADSVRVARQNIERNAVAGSIELIHGDASEADISGQDLVVANVTVDVHRAICENYAIAPRLIISGLLCSQVAQLVALLPEHTAKRIKTSGEWAAVDFCRTALPDPDSNR